jgi:hypothetical protein
MEYALLLEEIGIFNHGLVEVKPTTIPSIDWGDDKYVYHDGVHDRHFNEVHFALDYDQEQHYARNKKGPHHYYRRERFKTTLYQLANVSGETPVRIRNIVRQSLPPRINKNKLWNEIRGILKDHKLSDYYNRIPNIIYVLTGLKPVLPVDTLKQCIDDFFVLSYKFDNGLAKVWEREYFPNLRYICFKLMHKYGAVYPYKVPFIRTARKRKYLNKLWEDFYM